MFETFKKEIKTGDKVKLFLTTGKEPEGIVLEIGENNILLQTNNGVKTRFFDKLIGGWDVLKNSIEVPQKEKSLGLSDNINMSNDSKTIRKIELNNSDEKRVFKNVEREINDLISKSQFDFALSQIEKELKSNNIEDKYKSSLLLKEAQIYSSIGNPDASEKAYQELVHFNEKIHSPANNLSHLYTELARLQSLKIERQKDALASIKKALTFNPTNNYALTLLKQFEGKDVKREIEIFNSTTDQQLLIEADDDSTLISRMIDLDIKEHKHTHPEIIKTGGKSTAYIAKLILNEAKKTKEGDLSERYPIYLEAAKAFSELNVGSYDLQDYLESVAFYAMLKGNSLFINFRNKVLHNEIDIVQLKRLSDSACSYYLESLNLLSNIDPKLLLGILSNYLKLNICIQHIENKTNIDLNTVFKGQFSDVFSSCLGNQNKDIERIAYNTILSVGASSINAWNRLTQIPKGTGRLYNEFYYDKNRLRIYDLINNIERININEKLLPGEFLKKIFNERKQKKESLSVLLSKILIIEFEPYNIQEFLEKFKDLDDFERFFTSTDIEIKMKVLNILNIVKPYLNRNQAERTNLLIQTRSIIEKLIIFINENTTFYGRSFFYGIISKWKKEIDRLLEEKISQSYPKLEPIIDPPYYILTDGEISLPLLIINNGEATAEGFSLNVIYESIVFENSLYSTYESNVEVASAGKVHVDLVIPEELLEDSQAIELKIEIIPIYQKKKLPGSFFEYTVEAEPESSLTYEDIPWRDGPIPPEQLFKGRKKLIADLAQHYLSVEKDKPYILYGLTRTGKSSIMEYLRKNLEGDSFITQGKEKLVLTFKWELNVADSYNKASDFWNYTLFQQTYLELEKYSIEFEFSLAGLKISDNNVRAKDFKIILDFLESQNLYPIFFVDEFSFIKSLIDKQTVNAAFLHTLRQYSLEGLASFIFAGTYDIKSLIKDPKYGITGQLVHAIDEQINEISDNAAEELVEVINEKLSFTPEAISHIKFLSGNIPYFIQIICKNCGYYACENKRRYIGYPELEKVIRVLIGQEPSNSNSLIKKLPENTFQNNQYSPADPNEVSVLISSITHFNKERVFDPRGISFSELQKLWADKKITAFRQKLAETIQLLMDKKILIQEEDEGMPIYKLSVDLFRRWWTIQHPDINLILTTLID